MNYTVNYKEHRLTGLKISENYKDFGNDTVSTYITDPIKEKDYIRAAVGVPAAGLRTILEGLDPLYEGVLDRKLEQTNFRTGRDIKEIALAVPYAVGNLLTLSPIKAVKNVGGGALGILRLPQSVPIDIVDNIGGYAKYRNETRSEINTALAA